VKIAFRVVLAIIVLGLLGASLFVSQPIAFFRRAPNPILVDPARLEEHVRRLVAEQPRNLRSPERLDAAADYIRDRWRGCGVEVEEQRFVADKHGVRNLIAVLGPRQTDPIVVGAHYDAFGDMPGADDNASGAAGLIELACAWRQRPPPGSVEIVAFTLEEPPYFGSREMGSAVHVESLRRSNRRARAMICLEMIGDFSDQPGSQSFPFPALKLIYPTRGNFIAVVGRPADRRLVGLVKKAMAGVSGLRVRSMLAPPRLTGIDLSDHGSYWKAGFPAVMITDTAFYRNSRYHTAQDRPETLDYKRMATAVAGVYEAVRELARGGGGF
jgi:Zn-dependent M28 family amino/carboxypeptidase